MSSTTKGERADKELNYLWAVFKWDLKLLFEVHLDLLARLINLGKENFFRQSRPVDSDSAPHGCEAQFLKALF